MESGEGAAVSLSIVVPVFNEVEVIGRTFERLREIAGQPPLAGLERVEIIFVNDGSRDGTDAALERLRKCAGNGRVDCKVLHFSRNFGHSAAVMAGLQEAAGTLVAIIDADLQDPPELIPAMCAEVLAGSDVVYGKRVQRDGEGWFKRLTAWAFYRLLNSMTGVEIPKDTGDFRVMTREVRDAVLSCREQDPFLRGLVAWVGFRQKPFPYARAARELGETKYPLSHMLRFAAKAILSFSEVPLTLALYLGNLGFVFALLVSGWALWEHARAHVVPGWTSLLLGFLFGNSIVLIIMGALGLYLGQIFKNVQARPLYILRRNPPVANDSNE